MYTQKVQARLSTHQRLDTILRHLVQKYVRYHLQDSEYWEKECKPYVALISEHYKFAKLSSRPLKHYANYVEKLAVNSPQNAPKPKRAQAFLSMIEEWYWREYP